MAKKYWIIFHGSDIIMPAMTNKKITVDEAEKICAESKVAKDFGEYGLPISIDFNLLNGFTYTENKMMAKKVWKEKMMQWLTEQSGTSQSFEEEMMNLCK